MHLIHSNPSSCELSAPLEMNLMVGKMDYLESCHHLWYELRNCCLKTCVHCLLDAVSLNEKIPSLADQAMLNEFAYELLDDADSTSGSTNDSGGSMVKALLLALIIKAVWFTVPYPCIIVSWTIWHILRTLFWVRGDHRRLGGTDSITPWLATWYS